MNSNIFAAIPGSEAVLHYEHRLLTPPPTPTQDIPAFDFECPAGRLYDSIVQRSPAAEEDPILHSLIISSLNAEVQSFYAQKVDLTTAQCRDLCVKTVSQKCTLWKNARHLRITGSNCYKFYTYRKNASPDWHRKLNSVLNSKFSGNLNTKHGLECEPKARDLYVQQFQRNVDTMGFVVNPNCPWLGFSPDGITYDNGEPILIEIKSPIIGKSLTAAEAIYRCPFVSFKDKKDKQYPILKKNHCFYGQVQLGMELMKLNRCHFIVYSSYDNSCFVLEVARDVIFIHNLVSALSLIYENHFLPFVAGA